MTVLLSVPRFLKLTGGPWFVDRVLRRWDASCQAPYHRTPRRLSVVGASRLLPAPRTLDTDDGRERFVARKTGFNSVKKGPWTPKLPLGAGESVWHLRGFDRVRLPDRLRVVGRGIQQETRPSNERSCGEPQQHEGREGFDACRSLCWNRDRSRESGLRAGSACGRGLARSLPPVRRLQWASYVSIPPCQRIILSARDRSAKRP